MENGGGGGIKVGARARVSVELKPGKTTVVSWKKLLREANFHYSSSDSDSIDEPVAYVQEEKELKTKTLDSLSNQKKILQLASKTESSRLANNHTKRRKKDTRESLEEKNEVQLPSKYKKRGHQQIFATENEPCVGLHSISQVFQNHEANLQNSSRVSLKKCSDSNGALDFSLCTPLPTEDTGRVFLGNMHGKTETLIVHSRDPGDNGTSFVPTAANQKYIQKKSAQLNPESHRSAFNNHEQEGSTNNCVGSQKGKHELPDLNLPYTKTAQVTASMRLTDPSNSKGKKLERAIRRLENLILTSKPPLIDVQEADASSVAVERSLPQEIKEKLAEIVSLTRLIDGNISEELIDRLMGILGKYLHRKNLKRILREMVIKEFSVVKEGDNDIKQFKKDIVEMIRVRATLEAKASEYQDDSTNDFQRLPSFEEKVGRNIFIMDNKVEDKLCDLYDAFVQGLDDYIAHSLARRLYAQLAALWPKGTMDKHEIQKAICRAQDRKRILSSQTDKDGEKYKTNKLSIRRTDGCVNGKDSSGSQARTVHKKL